MSDKSAIEWTDATWNPTTGCTKISPGCAHCYIERTPAFRIAGNRFVDGKTDIRIFHDRLEQPLHWRKPRRVFVNSLSDLFHEDISDAFIDRVFAVMARAPQHTFQVLTKRPARMLAWFRRHGPIYDDASDFIALALADGDTSDMYPIEFGWPLPNVWLGVSVENQHFADERIPLLLQTPAAVRFISAEPLLGPVALREYLGPRCDVCGLTATCFGVYEDPESEPRYACDRCCGHGNEDGWCKPVSEGGISDSPRGLDWVIVGGESGPGARPFEVAWARSIVAQCKAAGVPVFVKQLGTRVQIAESPLAEWLGSVRLVAGPTGGMGRVISLAHPKGGDPAEWPEDLRVRQFPASCEPARPLAAGGRR